MGVTHKQQKWGFNGFCEYSNDSCDSWSKKISGKCPQALPPSPSYHPAYIQPSISLMSMVIARLKRD